MSKIIVIDAGHDANTPGKRCLKKLDAAETREWVLNDRIADRVEELLKSYDCKVLRADDTTGKKDISLSARVKTANNAKADIYISIHHNAGVNGGNGGGTVVYSYKNASDRARAARLYTKVIEQTNLIGNRASKTSVGNFHVINATKMPALLLENGFMDSATDVPIILTTEHAEKTAIGIVNFLINECALKKKEIIVETEPNKYYPACAKNYYSISDALTSIGVNGSYSFRRKIAAKNNIGGLGGKAYVGSSTQNTQMLNLLKAGLLKKA